MAEFRDPPGVERAADDKNMTKMLRDGELDAAIYGAELPERSGAPERHPRSGSRGGAWFAKHTASCRSITWWWSPKALAQNPIRSAVREVYPHAARRASARPGCPGRAIDLQPFGFEACRPAVEMMTDYALQQKLLPRPLTVDELFDDTTRALG